MTHEARTASRRSPVRRTVTRLVACALVLVLLVIGVGLFLQHRLASRLHRIPGAFAGLEDRPARPQRGEAARAVNILLLGTDRRPALSLVGDSSPAPTWARGATRIDTLMLVHVDGDRLGASVISLPLSAQVAGARSAEAGLGDVLSAADPATVVETVEHLTQVRVDHLAAVDWDLVRELTEAQGGVDLTVPEPVHDPDHHLAWPAGRQRFDGTMALDYVEEQYGVRGDEVARVHRQQNLLQALLDATLEQEMRKRPWTVYRFLDTLCRHLSVDTGWSTGDMRDLVISLRDLRSAQISYLTVPVSGAAGPGGSMRLTGDGQGLWQAVRDDTVGAWLAEHPSAGIPEVVR